MKTVLVMPLMLLSLVFFALPAQYAEGSEGEQAFVENCAICHPGGKNIINPAKALHRDALSANGIRDAAGIVRNMRNPGPGMTKFDEKTIPEETAKAIAEYILETFR